MQDTHDTYPKETPLQLARDWVECRMRYLSTDDDEARDHWRGEYERIKRRYDALLKSLKKTRTNRSSNGYS